jgi:hypothetical protein
MGRIELRREDASTMVVAHIEELRIMISRTSYVLLTGNPCVLPISTTGESVEPQYGIDAGKQRTGSYRKHGGNGALVPLRSDTPGIRTS